MGIDPYAPCPCGSGKKLKFCCSDLAGDIEKIYKLISGEQPHAALKRIEQLLSKDKTRASLLDLQIAVLISLEDLDQARTVCEQFLDAHPENPSAQAQQALLLASMEKGREAIEPLQRALELLDDDMPTRVLEAIGAVGHALLLGGDMIAGRAHLLAYSSIYHDEDNLALELLVRLNIQGGLPLLLRDYLFPKFVQDDAAWKPQFQEAARQIARGKWRKAEATYRQLYAEHGPIPEVVYNLALVRGWQGDPSEMAARLHEYGRLEVPLIEAVEAEALAQLIDPELADPTLQTICLSYQIDDAERVSELLQSDKRVRAYPLNQSEVDEVARPRSTHILLDRPAVESAPEIARGDVPIVLAFLSVYGNRTDRAAQLDMTTERDEGFAFAEGLLKEILGDSLGEILEEEVVAEKSLAVESLTWRWHLPKDLVPAHRQRLLIEQRREAILERWINAPRAALADQTPLEVVGADEWKVPLHASVLTLEQNASNPDELAVFDELRELLHLAEIPLPETTDDDLDYLPLVRIPHLDLSQFDAESLDDLLKRTILTGANLTTLLVAGELALREELPAEVDRETAFEQLIRHDPNLVRAREWSARARAWSEAEGRSVAPWALLELDLAIESGDAPAVREALIELRTEHLEEPGVMEKVYTKLSRAGLLADPRERLASRPQREPMPPTAPTTGIWTPDHGNVPAPHAVEDQERKSAIWTP